MNGITITLFVLLGAAAGMMAAPAAFADHATTEVTNAEGSSLPGCERTNECFVPHVVTIDVGSEVKWTNSDLAAHTVTSGVLAEGGADGEFNSGLFLPGTEFSYVFEEAGRYPYFCLAHPWMSGLIIVQGTTEDGGGADPVMDDVEDRFITTWETTYPGDSITIPVGGAAGAYVVDWGDGSVTTHTGDAVHAYDTAGNHTIRISGDFTRIMLGDDAANVAKLRSIDQWGDTKWSTMYSAFSGAPNMVYRATDAPDLSEVTDMSWMFHNTPYFNGDLSSWDTSSVTNMSWMFADTDSFNGNISSWDVSSVVNITSMFAGATSFNGDISSWDTSSVTDMSAMFWASSFNSSISSWDTSSVTDMSQMFQYSNFNGDLSSWDTSSVTDMSKMLAGSTFNGDVSSWDTSSVTDMYAMFAWTSFNGDLSSWDTSSVTDMSRMFWETKFNGDLSSWDTSSVTDMSWMFFGASFNGDVSSWDTSSVTDMSWMFLEASSFNGDISSWDVSSVTDMSWMLAGSAFNGDLSSWNVSSVTDMSWMFAGAHPFNGDVSSWDTSSVTDMRQMFHSAISFNGDVSSWDTSSVTDMSWMFLEASSFNGDISSWDVSSVTRMAGMFDSAVSFDQNLGDWYVNIDNTPIERADVPGVVGTISAKNAFLDMQNPTYVIEPGDDSHRFTIVDGNKLSMVSAATDRTTYAVTIAASGDSVFEDGNNRRTIQVTLME